MKGYVKRIGYGNKEKACCPILFRFKKLFRYAFSYVFLLLYGQVMMILSFLMHEDATLTVNHY